MIIKKGDIIQGHFCFSCLPYVDKAIQSKENPEKTDWCKRCEHRAAGINSTGKVGDWLVIGKST